MSSVESDLFISYQLDFVLKMVEQGKAAGWWSVQRINYPKPWRCGAEPEPTLYGPIFSKDVKLEEFLTMLAYGFRDYKYITVTRGHQTISTEERLIATVDGKVYPVIDHFDNIGVIRWYMRASDDRQQARKVKVFRLDRMEGEANAA